MTRLTSCRPIALISSKPSPRWEANISPSSVPISVGEKTMRMPAEISESAAAKTMRTIRSNGPNARA